MVKVIKNIGAKSFTQSLSNLQLVIVIKYK